MFITFNRVIHACIRRPLFLGGFSFPRRFPKPPTVHANRRGTTFGGSSAICFHVVKNFGCERAFVRAPPVGRQFVSTSAICFHVVNECMHELYMYSAPCPHSLKPYPIGIGRRSRPAASVAQAPTSSRSRSCRLRTYKIRTSWISQMNHHHGW